MTKKKKRWIIIGAIFGGILVTVINSVGLLLFANFPSLMILIFGEDPPKPEVSYAEFPFELVYEINGERKEIKDTLIIEYEGIYWSGTSKRNDWKQYLKSQPGVDYNQQTLILFNGPVEGVGSHVTVHFELGSCEYYMGLEERVGSTVYRLGVRAGDVYTAPPSSDYGPISDEQLYEDFGIRIIKKSLSPPIKTKDSSTS